jgi:hypothetical protein
MTGRYFNAAVQHRLETAIQHFLACTVRWTPRWFNKPKFHVILHLPNHIRRFGPATLFATEAFESFNAVIRAKSIHSNRHAPSKDIAIAFAHGNRVRLLLSGAPFPVRTIKSTMTGLQPAQPRPHINNPDTIEAGEAGSWRRVGDGPMGLVRRPNIITNYLGLDSIDKLQNGAFIDTYIF